MPEKLTEWQGVFASNYQLPSGTDPKRVVPGDSYVRSVNMQATPVRADSICRLFVMQNTGQSVSGSPRAVAD